MEKINPEFLEFAKHFAKTYKEIHKPTGNDGPAIPIIYSSNKGTYHIEVHYQITEGKGRIVDTHMRINGDKNIIQIAALEFNKDYMTDNFIFFTLLWCYFKSYTKPTPEDIRADQMATDYYLEVENRPIKDIIFGYNLFLAAFQTDNNRQRLNFINS